MSTGALAGLARAHADLPPLGLRLGTAAADFVVAETLDAPPAAGPDLWLWTERAELDTAAVAAQLAGHFGVDRRDVTWAGRKDRDAVARQWFAVRGAAARNVPDAVGVIRVLDAQPGRGPLRRGRHAGNRFTLTLRGPMPGADELDAWAARLRAGVPAYVGAQRFGRDGANAARGEAILRGDRRVGDRRQRELLLHAWQSAQFNRVVDAWLRAGRPQDDGDLVWHALAHEALPRSAAPDAAPTGPLFGAKMPWPRGTAAARETAVLHEAGWTVAAIEDAAARQRLPGARRPMWLVPDRLDLVADPAGAVLQLALPPGIYATAVIRELTGRDDRGA